MSGRSIQSWKRSRGSNAAPAPRLIPAETKNQPRTNIESGTANGGTSPAYQNQMSFPAGPASASPLVRKPDELAHKKRRKPPPPAPIILPPIAPCSRARSYKASMRTSEILADTRRFAIQPRCNNSPKRCKSSRNISLQKAILRNKANKCFCFNRIDFLRR